MCRITKAAKTIRIVLDYETLTMNWCRINECLITTKVAGRSLALMSEAISVTVTLWIMSQTYIKRKMIKE